MKSPHQQFLIAALLVFTILLNLFGVAAQDGGEIIVDRGGDIAGGSGAFFFRVSRKKTHDRSAFRAASFNRPLQSRIETRRRRIVESKSTAAAIRPKLVGQTTATAVSMEKVQAAKEIVKGAKIYSDKKNLGEAEKGYREAHTLDPTNAEAQIGLAKVYAALGDVEFDLENYSKSVAYYEKSTTFDAGNPDAFAGMGDAYDALEQAGQLPNLELKTKALNAYQKAFDLNPRLTALFAPLGALYYAAGNYTKAENYLKQALDATPNETKLQDLYGLVLYRLERNQEALTALEKALTKNLNNPTLHYYLGEVYDRLGRPENAVAAYRKAIELDSKFVEAYYDLGVTYYNGGQYQEAAANYEKAKQLKGDYLEARLNLADTYRLLAETTDQAQYYVKAISEYQVIVLGYLPKPEYKEKINEAEVLSKFGYCLGRNKEWKRALEFLDKAAQKQPDAANYTNLAWAYNGDKNFSAAKQAAQEAINRNPNFAAAYYNLGNAQARLSDFAAAEQSFKQALKLKKDWAEAFNNLGYVYGSRNDWERAAEAHRNAVNADSKSAEARYNLAFAELKRGNRKAAERERDALLGLNPIFAQRLNLILKTAPPDKDKKKKKDKRDN